MQGIPDCVRIACGARKRGKKLNYEKKIEIMAAAVKAELGDTGRDEILTKGIIDGFLRIEQLEALEKKNVSPSIYFDVERIQEGFGFWNSGGFRAPNMGRSAVAAGADGEKLRIVRYLKETNGRHCLAVVYPGAFIAASVAHDMFESSNTAIYQVQGFVSGENGVQARCKKVFQVEPRYSLLTDEQEKRLERLIKVSNQVATTPDLVQMRNMV